MHSFGGATLQASVLAEREAGARGEWTLKSHLYRTLSHHINRSHVEKWARCRFFAEIRLLSLSPKARARRLQSPNNNLSQLSNNPTRPNPLLSAVSSLLPQLETPLSLYNLIPACAKVRLPKSFPILRRQRQSRVPYRPQPGFVFPAVQTTNGGPPAPPLPGIYIHTSLDGSQQSHPSPFLKHPSSHNNNNDNDHGRRDSYLQARACRRWWYWKGMSILLVVISTAVNCAACA